jgi:hypothetical protein
MSMNDEESEIAEDFLKGAKKAKVTLVDVDLDDERPIFFRDKDEKNGVECLYSATIVPKGTNGVDTWWIGGERVKELLDLLELLGLDPATYTWAEKGEKGAVHFNCKNRVRWKPDTIIKGYVLLRLDMLDMEKSKKDA